MDDQTNLKWPRTNKTLTVISRYTTAQKLGTSQISHQHEAHYIALSTLFLTSKYIYEQKVKDKIVF